MQSSSIQGCTDALALCTRIALTIALEGATPRLEGEMETIQLISDMAVAIYHKRVTMEELRDELRALIGNARKHGNSRHAETRMDSHSLVFNLRKEHVGFIFEDVGVGLQA